MRNFPYFGEKSLFPVLLCMDGLLFRSRSIGYMIKIYTRNGGRRVGFAPRGELTCPTCGKMLGSSVVEISAGMRCGHGGARYRGST